MTQGSIRWGSTRVTLLCSVPTEKGVLCVPLPWTPSASAAREATWDPTVVPSGGNAGTWHTPCPSHFYTPSPDNLGGRSPSLDSNRKHTHKNSTQSSPSQPPSHIPASWLPLAVLGCFGPGPPWSPNQLVLPTALTSHHCSHWMWSQQRIMTSGQQKTRNGSRWSVYFHADEAVGGYVIHVWHAFLSFAGRQRVGFPWGDWWEWCLGFPFLKGGFDLVLLDVVWLVSWFCCAVICFREELEIEYQGRTLSPRMVPSLFTQRKFKWPKVRVTCLGICQTPGALVRKLATLRHQGLMKLPFKDKKGKGESPGMEAWSHPCHHIKESGHSLSLVMQETMAQSLITIQPREVFSTGSFCYFPGRPTPREGRDLQLDMRSLDLLRRASQVALV